MGGGYLLFESASGYLLCEVVESEGIGAQSAEAQRSITDLARFSKIVKFIAFSPYANAEVALENCMSVSEGLLHDDLKNFLELHLPKVKASKKSKYWLGVQAPNLGSAIQSAVGFPCRADETSLELLRGVRMHFTKFIKQLDKGGAEQAQLGLGHSYSRAKVKFNVNRQDNMIIQAICLLDQLDKDLNKNAMRAKEWYSWHFPELANVVGDNVTYARIVHVVGPRSNLLDGSKVAALTEITQDEKLTSQIVDAAKMSMGMDVSAIDMINIRAFADRVRGLAAYRKQLHGYLLSKMNAVAPNLGTLVGETVAARLISHAGSLTKLAKCPASTVQILGAEKALFRALKTKGNTPKYGLIFHSSFIGRASQKNKGRISRYLANKCAIAARVDSFSEIPTTAYGEKLKEQVEERLAFYDTGKPPQKNVDAMAQVAQQLAAERAANGNGKAPAAAADAAPNGDDAAKSAKKAKKAAKKAAKKKRKREEEAASANEGSAKKDKKKKKKKHKK